MKDKIGKSILYIIFTTGAALILLAVYRALTDDKNISAYTVFQILGTNTIIIIGLNLTNKIESSYALLEYLIDTGCTIVLLIISGFIFDWYSEIPVWYLIFMGVAIYFIGVLINIARNRKDIEEINKLLKKRSEKV